MDDYVRSPIRSVISPSPSPSPSRSSKVCQIVKYSPLPIENYQSFLQLTNTLAAQHHLLLGSLSLSVQLQDIRKRNESKSNNRTHRSGGSGGGGNIALGSRGRLTTVTPVVTSVSGNQENESGADRDRLMQLGEEELMKLIQQGFQSEIKSRERDRLFPMDYLQEGWSMMDIFFVQVFITSPLSTSSSRLILCLAIASSSWLINNLEWSL